MRVDEIKSWAAGRPPLSEEEEQAELRRRVKSHWRGSLWDQLGLFLLALLLWPVPIINPIKLLVVLFHEIAHVAAAYLTGGVVFGIAIDPGGAGVTLGMGGNMVVIAAAGYAGSLAIGMFLYWLTARWESGEVWAVLCGLCSLSLAFGWVNNFTALFGYGTIGLMVIGAFYTADELKKGILRWVATTCCLYPVIDAVGESWFQSDGFRINGQMVASDISRLAQLSGLSAGVIGVLWIVVGLAVTLMMVLWSADKDAQGELRRSLRPRRQGDDMLSVWANDPYHPVRWRVR